MILDKGEFLICSGFCSLMYYEQENPGMLYLTNYKLLFEAGAGGPNPYTAYYEGLTTVWNVHSGMTSRFLEGKREFLTIEGARGRFVFRVIDAPTWADKIVTAKKNLPPPPPPSQSSSTRPIPSPLGLGAQTPVVVNVQAPQAPQIMMHCRHCGNLYDATKGRCDKCGAPTT